MTTYPKRHLTTGGDPRTLADYAKLREEMHKLSHPARPDVDWLYAERLCLSLFDRNGVELQTAAWYTLARTQLTGLSGLNEGLAILEMLITRQWGSLWPQPVHARMEILSGLGKRLQQALRTLTLTYADLSLIYEAEAHLKALDAALQRLELKHASQFDALLNLMHNAAVRLENSDGVTSADTLPHIVAMENASTHLDERVERTKWIYIAPPETLPHVQAGNERQNSEKRWRPFVAGMLTMLALAAAAGWGWQAMAKPEPEQRQFALSLAPLPTVLSPDQLRSFSQHAPPADDGIKQTRQQLSDLAQLKPNWAIDYSEQLVQQAQVLWPEQAKALSSQWRQQIIAAALPA